MMLNMRYIPFCFDKLENVLRVVGLIRTKMLLAVGSLFDDMNYQIIDRPFVMFISTCDMDRQGSTAFIHQKMNFCSRFGAIRRIFAGLSAAKWREDHFAVHRLPHPANFHLVGIIINHDLKQLIENSFLLPGLKPLMQSAARYLEPFPLHRFPLASAPQNVPDAVDHISIVYARSSRSVLFPPFGKMLLEFLPQFWQQLMEVYRSAFCAILIHGVRVRFV